MSLMPIYEFRCSACGRTTSHFTRQIDTEITVPCGECGSPDTSRMMSAFGRSYSRGDIVDRYGDPSGSRSGDFRDPRQIGGQVEQAFARRGMEVPSDLRTMIESSREGVLPDQAANL